MNVSKENLPKISIVMPLLNEAENVRAALLSLFHNGYPLDLIEFLLIDGGSVDGTREIVSQLFEQNGIKLVLLDNPAVRTPSALNIGIRASKNEIILRADAHAIYRKNYISRSVQALVSGVGDNVGGRIIARSSGGHFGRALSRVLNTPIGNGGASYRTGGHSRVVDTVWCGCWFKKTLFDIGLFDEKWLTNQDAELNARMTKAGMRVIVDPEIIAELTVRSCYRGFLKQYFHYGRGRCKTIQRHPNTLKLRQFVPFLFLGGVLVLALAFPILPLLILILVFIAALLNNGSFFGVYGWFLPIVIGMNFAWVMGFLSEYLQGLLRLAKQ